MLNVLHTLEVLRHNNFKPVLLPGWTRKDIEQLPNFFFLLRVEILNVLYILKALRHNNIMPGLLPEWTRKDIEQLPNFFFSATGRNAKRVIYPRGTSDLEADISSSRLSHCLFRRMSALFCLIKESLSENREIRLVILLQTTNNGWPERHVELCRHPAEYNLAAFRETISSSIQIYLFVC